MILRISIALMLLLTNVHAHAEELRDTQCQPFATSPEPELDEAQQEAQQIALQLNQAKLNACKNENGSFKREVIQFPPGPRTDETEDVSCEELAEEAYKTAVRNNCSVDRAGLISCITNGWDIRQAFDFYDNLEEVDQALPQGDDVDPFAGKLGMKLEEHFACPGKTEPADAIYKAISCNIVSSAAAMVPLGSFVADQLINTMVPASQRPAANECVDTENSCLTQVIWGAIQNVFTNIQGLYDLGRLAVQEVGNGIRAGWDWLVGNDNANDAASDQAAVAARLENDIESNEEAQEATGNWAQRLVNGILEAAGEGTLNQFSCSKWEGGVSGGGAAGGLANRMSNGVGGSARCTEAAPNWECASAKQKVQMVCGVAGFIGGEVITTLLTGGAVRGLSLAGKGLASAANNGSRVARATLAVGRGASGLGRGVLSVAGKGVSLVMTAGSATARATGGMALKIGNRILPMSSTVQRQFMRQQIGRGGVALSATASAVGSAGMFVTWPVRKYISALDRAYMLGRYGNDGAFALRNLSKATAANEIAEAIETGMQSRNLNRRNLLPDEDSFRASDLGSQAHTELIAAQEALQNAQQQFLDAVTAARRGSNGPNAEGLIEQADAALRTYLAAKNQLKPLDEAYTASLAQHQARLAEEARLAELARLAEQNPANFELRTSAISPGSSRATTTTTRGSTSTTRATNSTGSRSSSGVSSRTARSTTQTNGATATNMNINDAVGAVENAWQRTERYLRQRNISVTPDNQEQVALIFDQFLSRQVTPLGPQRAFRRESGVRIVDAMDLSTRVGTGPGKIPEFIARRVTVDHHGMFGIGLAPNSNSTTQILDLLEPGSGMSAADFNRFFSNFASDNIGDAYGLARFAVQNADILRANPALRNRIRELSIQEDFKIFGLDSAVQSDDTLAAVLRLSDRTLPRAENTFMDRISLNFNSQTSQALDELQVDLRRVLLPQNQADRDLITSLAQDFRTALGNSGDALGRGRVSVRLGDGEAPILLANTTSVKAASRGPFEEWSVIPDYVRLAEANGSAPIQRTFTFSGADTNATRDFVFANFSGRGTNMFEASLAGSDSFLNVFARSEANAIRRRIAENALDSDQLTKAQATLKEIEAGTWRPQNRPDGSLMFGQTYMKSDEIAALVRSEPALRALGLDASSTVAPRVVQYTDGSGAVRLRNVSQEAITNSGLDDVQRAAALQRQYPSLSDDQISGVIRNHNGVDEVGNPVLLSNSSGGTSYPLSCPVGTCTTAQLRAKLTNLTDPNGLNIPGDVAADIIRRGYAGQPNSNFSVASDGLFSARPRNFNQNSLNRRNKVELHPDHPNAASTQVLQNLDDPTGSTQLHLRVQRTNPDGTVKTEEVFGYFRGSDRNQEVLYFENSSRGYFAINPNDPNLVIQAVELPVSRVVNGQMRADSFRPLYETDPQRVLANNQGNRVTVTYRTEDGDIWDSTGEVVMHEGRLQLKSRNQYNGAEFVYSRLDDVEIESIARSTPAANWSYNRGRPSDLEETFEAGMQVDITFQRPASRFSSSVEEANISGEYLGVVLENNTYSAAVRLPSGTTEYIPLTTAAQTSISAKAATQPITSFVRRNPAGDIVSATGRSRPRRVQALDGDDQLTIYNRNKDLYDERSALNPQQRGDLAEDLLERPLNAQQRACINSAHNDVPGNFATYTNAQNSAKGLILARCGFSMADIRVLMREGVTGRAESEGIISSILGSIRNAFDGGAALNTTARAIGRRPIYHGTSSRNLKRICDSGVLTAGVAGVGTLHNGAVGVVAGKPLGTTSLDTAVRYSNSAANGGYDSFAQMGLSGNTDPIVLRTYPIMGTQDLSSGSSQALKDQTRRFNRPVPTSRLDVSFDGGRTFNRLDCSQLP